MRPVALDAGALIAYLDHEPGGEHVFEWVHQAIRGERRLLIHRITLGEVYYLTLSTRGAQAADLLLAEVRRLPIEESSTLSFDLLHVAATLKLEHGVPYVDAIAGAWAIRNSALFATTDRRGFRKAASAQALDVRFIR